MTNKNCDKELALFKVGIETAKDIVDAWLGAEYEGGRHQVRIDMLAEIETTQSLKAAEE